MADDLGIVDDSDLGLVDDHPKDAAIDIQPDPSQMFPYDAAIKKLKKSGDWGRLNLDQKKDILAKGAQMNPEATSKAMAEAVSFGNPFSPELGPLKKIIGKAAGRVMELALGVKKALPGTGEVALKEGLVGTRGMMAKQAAKRAAAHTGELENAVAGLEGNISHNAVASDVGSMADNYMTSGGELGSEGSVAIPKIDERLAKISARRGTSATDALEFKRMAQAEGYKHGEPMAKLNSQLAQKEASGYGKQLESLYGKENPGAPNVIADSNYNISRLLKAKKSAERGAAPGIAALLTKGASLAVAPALSVGAQASRGVGAVADPLAALLLQKASEQRTKDADLGIVEE